MPARTIHKATPLWFWTRVVFGCYLFAANGLNCLQHEAKVRGILHVTPQNGSPAKWRSR